jgi:hypothetical protein
MRVAPKNRDQCSRFSVAVHEHVLECPFAGHSIDREVVVNTGYLRNAQPLGQRDERNIGEVRRQVGVFVEKGGDPRQIRCHAVINLERAVSPQEKVTLRVDRMSSL